MSLLQTVEDALPKLGAGEPIFEVSDDRARQVIDVRLMGIVNHQRVTTRGSITHVLLQSAFDAKKVVQLVAEQMWENYSAVVEAEEIYALACDEELRREIRGS